MTPVWLAGMLYLVPALALPGCRQVCTRFLLSLRRCRVLMRCTPQQALPYAFAALAACAFVLWLSSAGMIVTALMGFGPVMFD